MKPGNVSTAIIGPKLAMLIRDRWPHGGGIVVLAEKVGCDPSAIESVIEQTNPGVSFDLADKMFCALGRPMEDVGLGDIYWSVEFRETCSVPSCGNQFPEQQVADKVKKTCSPRCGALYAQVKRGRCSGERLRQKGRCLRGHKMEGENVYISPKSGKRVCVACRRESQREWKRKQRADYRVESDRRYYAKKAAE